MYSERWQIKARRVEGCHWSGWGQHPGALTGKLSPGCLADTGQTSLTNEGLCPVHWGELTTSWPDGNKINFKLLVILIRNLKGIKD